VSVDGIDDQRNVCESRTIILQESVRKKEEKTVTPGKLGFAILYSSLFSGHDKIKK